MESVSYLINEIYPCLQGEGINLGKPSLLVRFQLCNLRCAWCDTPYTHTYKSDPVDKNNPQGAQKYKRKTQKELIAEIESYAPLKHLILTGGEPTLQNIGLLMEQLHKEGYTAEVESNATRIPHLETKGFLKSHYQLMQWNLSPKFENAGEKINEKSMHHWGHLCQTQKNIYFKFVIRKQEYQEDLNIILDLQKKFDLPASQIILMAEGVTQESQLNNIWLHDICLKYQFRYTPRMHILIFGNQRRT